MGVKSRMNQGGSSGARKDKINQDPRVLIRGIPVIAFAALLMALPAQAVEGQLTDYHFNRIRAAQHILAEVDGRTPQAIREEFNQTQSPEGNLQIHEAVAATYQELVERKRLVTIEEKLELYKFIRLNVAFIQFGGNPSSTRDQKLNQWIRQTLTRYLSKDLMRNRDLFYKAEQWNK